MVDDKETSIAQDSGHNDLETAEETDRLIQSSEGGNEQITSESKKITQHYAGLLPPILDEQAAYNITQHKYSGSDEGIFYTYCWNPFANKMVCYLPDWIAPNTITLLGFMHTVAPFLLLFYIAELDLLGDVPNWFFFLQAYSFFAYRMLDEMDGKQARRTGNSSPLGLMFDHGCDAFTTVLQALISLRTVQIGNNMLAYTFIVINVAAFYFATLEEYYVGTLRLPMINAVSEGTVLIVLVYLFSGLNGNSLWLTPFCDATWLGIDDVTELTLGQIVIAVLCVIPIYMIFCNIYTIIRSRYTPQETQTEQVCYKDLALQSMSFFAWAAVWFAAGYAGKDPIIPKVIQVDEESSVEHDEVQTGQGYFIIYSLLFGSIAVHNTIGIMLAHVSRSKYQPFTKLYLFAIVALGTLALAATVLETSAVSMKVGAMIITAVVAALQWSYLVLLIKEVSTILGISVFTTKQSIERQNAKAIKEE